MTKGFWIIFSNSGGELDRAFAKTHELAASTLASMITDLGELQDGDRFTIEEGETEQFDDPPDPYDAAKDERARIERYGD